MRKPNYSRADEVFHAYNYKKDILVLDKEHQVLYIGNSWSELTNMFNNNPHKNIYRNGFVFTRTILIPDKLVKRMEEYGVTFHTFILKETSAVLNEREKNYGSFEKLSNIVQDLENVLQKNEAYKKLNDPQKTALNMILHKIGRITNGNPNYADSWVDIAGYAQLVVNSLEKEAN